MKTALFPLAHRLAALVCAAALLAPAPAHAGRQDDHDRRVKNLTEYFGQVQSKVESAVPNYLLRRAKGIVILKQWKAAFGWGIKGGGGVALVRLPNGQWSPPAFMQQGEGSLGWQIGGQSMQTVMVILTDKGMDGFRNPKFRIGVDAAAVAGPTGADAEAKVGNADILVYGDAAGLFAGVSIEGGFFIPNDRYTEELYAVPGLTLREVLFENKVQHRPSTRALVEAIERAARQ